MVEIIGRNVVAERDEKKQLTRLICPHYHQLDVMRKLVAAESCFFHRGKRVEDVIF